MKQALNLSLKRILGSSYLKYLEEVIRPQLERLAKEGKISPNQLRKIADLVDERGIDVLAPQVTCLDDITLNTLERDGYVLEAVLPITDEVIIRNVIKKSSSKEDFNRAVRLQWRVYDLLKGTELEGSVPNPSFVNKKQRITVTPYVEGRTLKRELGEDEDVIKEISLTDVIDDYVALFSRLRDRDIGFPESIEDFNEFFIKHYLDGKTEGREKLAELFKRNFGDSLNRGRRYNIHGDLHVKNVLLNGRSVFLDWANAASNGFPEFDIGKLLTKADIGRDLEDRLVEYAAGRLFDTENDRRESVERYTRNQIVQELLGARRYLDKAEEAKSAENRDRLNNMALVYYNTAVRRIRKAEEKGLVDREFSEELSRYKPRNSNFTLEEISDEALKELKIKYNPNLLMSQENFASSTPLANISLPAEDSIGRISRSLRFARLRRLGQIAALSLLGTASLFGAGAVVNYFKELKYERERELNYESSEENYARSSYAGIFDGAFRRLQRDILDDKIKNRLPLDSGIIDDVAKEQGIDPDLLRRIMRVNRVYGEIDWSDRPEARGIEDVNLLDPFVIDDIYKNPSLSNLLDPLENLRLEAIRLASLLRENCGNVEKALTKFYTPRVDDGLYPGNNTKYGDARTNNARRRAVDDEVQDLVFNVRGGLGYAYDGGIKSMYIRSALLKKSY